MWKTGYFASYVKETYCSTIVNINVKTLIKSTWKFQKSEFYAKITRFCAVYALFLRYPQNTFLVEMWKSLKIFYIQGKFSVENC